MSLSVFSWISLDAILLVGAAVAVVDGFSSSQSVFPHVDDGDGMPLKASSSIGQPPRRRNEH